MQGDVRKTVESGQRETQLPTKAYTLASIPSLEKDSGEWLSTYDGVAEKFGWAKETMSQQRSKGKKRLERQKGNMRKRGLFGDAIQRITISSGICSLLSQRTRENFRWQKIGVQDSLSERLIDHFFESFFLAKVFGR